MTLRVETTEEHRSSRQRAARWLRPLMVVGLLLRCADVFGAPAKDHDQKFDHVLRQQVRQGSSSDGIKVIVTTKPGKRGAVVKRLIHDGAKVNAQYALTDAVVARLSKGQARKLAKDGDVVAISSDAKVHSDGLAVEAVGAAANSPYTLRGTLGLETVSSVAASKTFTQGVNGYSAGVNAGLASQWPTWTSGTASRVTVIENGSSGNNSSGIMVRFDALFGDGANQIPYGSQITSVSLTVVSRGDGSPTASASVYRVLAPWNAASSWASMTTSGAGLQRDNVEVGSSSDASVSDLTELTHVFTGGGMVDAVQSWANGAPNRGWLLWQSSSRAWTVNSHHSYDGGRPSLKVTYKPRVNATAANGAGVTVAVIDSGIAGEAFETGRILTSRDFTSGLANPPAAYAADAYGHGTHVAGLVGSNQPELRGVAPGVKLVNLRVLDSTGQGTTSNVLLALQWAVVNRAAYGIDVVNLSLGHPIYESAHTDPLVQAVETAVRAGLVVVVSAGNMGQNLDTHEVGYAGITSPGNAPSALTVGALKTLDTERRGDDLVADFSSRGPTWYDAFAKPDVVAPGHRLVSLAGANERLLLDLPTMAGLTASGKHTLRLSGTSMAAAVVTGTVALMVDASRDAFGQAHTSNAVKAMLEHSSLKMTDASGLTYDVLTQGAGALNAIGAVTLAESLNPGAP
ncbi:MAG TPA: S8 family serine peptidase, partial [Vicinamibacterales bacterium]|nr:S8 family serine peptidase [Vicinamibacterales bacterium]